MLPRYVLPARESGPNINLETKPKQVEAWITRLPLSNPGEAAEEMADYLATLNSIEVSYDNRAKIIERLAPVIEDIVAALHEQYGAIQPPLLGKQYRNANLAQRLLMAMADSYKILLLDWLKRRFHLFGGNPVSLYLQRILLALQAALEISFETHNPMPAGIWVDLHQTYNYALRNGLKDAIPEGGGKMLSLEQIYKASLLMVLADPYHFPQIELPWAKDIIARFSNLASIFPAEEETRRYAGLFMVEVNTDSPPKPLVRESHPMNPRWDLIINTTELVKHIALIASQIKGRDDLEKIGLPEAARDPAYPSMLRRLKLNWGASLQRQSQRRSHQDGREFDVCFGLKAVHQLIAPEGQHDTIHYGMAGSDPAPTIIRCKIVNDSMGGLALSKAGITTLQIRVGDVVGVRQGNGTWGVGLVRWFRVPGQGEIFFGLQLLAPKALAIQLRRLDNGQQWPCLLLHPDRANQQIPMLLAQPGCFVPDSPAEILTPKDKQPVSIEKRMESTPSVEIYRFHMGATAQGN
jgi:cyclic-di-GMP-binding protein